MVEYRWIYLPVPKILFQLYYYITSRRMRVISVLVLGYEAEYARWRDRRCVRQGVCGVVNFEATTLAMHRYD